MTIVGRSQLAAPISSAGVVLSQPTSRMTPSIGLARIDSSTSMLDQIAKKHRRRAHRCFAQRNDRKFQRKAARFINAAFDGVGNGAKMRVARRQLRPGIADADDRPPIEEVIGKSLVLHPTAMDESALVRAPEPFRAAEAPFS